MDRKLLLIIDTFYFLHRSFHAYPKDLQTSNGTHTNILFGFAQSILDIISELNPTHIVCGWESEELPSFRKELYKDYQSTRAPMEEEDAKIFKSQIPLVIKFIDALNIPRVTENGFEGDDVVGTMSVKFQDQADVIIATSDQDMMQLINDKIFVYRPGRPPFVPKVIYNEEKFIEKYKFGPKQMIDYKALRGDPSDSIPGVKGIGEKIATDLLVQFGTLENIYNNIDSVVSKSVKEKLVKDKDNAFLSKQLATIITDIPIKSQLDDCEVHDFDPNEIRDIFNQYELYSLNKKLEKLIVVKGIKDKLKDDLKPKDQPSLF